MTSSIYRLIDTIFHSNSRTCVLLFLTLVFCLARPCAAEVYYAKDEALALAFPAADKIETQTYVLTDQQKAQAEDAAKCKIESALFTIYSGFKDGQLIGYAAIDSHNVRTMSETFMVVFSPQGIQKKVVILAFYEPPEYIASQRWLDQFIDKPINDDLWPGREIDGIAGSTFTTNAVTMGVRKVATLVNMLAVRR